MPERIAKTCPRCCQSLELSEFGVHAQAADGLQSWCKPCCRSYARQRRAAMTAEQVEDRRRRGRERMKATRDADPEAARAAMRAWCAANSERLAERKRASRLRNIDAEKERAKRYRQENSERIAEYHREYNRLNLEKRLEKNRRWLAANPEKKIEYQLRRRALKAKARVGSVDLKALWTGFCGLCGGEMDPSLKRPDVMSKSVDHIVPLSLGGAHSQDNLQWAHLSCNLSKGNRI